MENLENNLVNYRKLRMYLAEHNLKLTVILRDIGLAKYIVTKINNNQNIEIYTLAKICKYLGIEIGEAVEVVKGND